MISTNFKIEDRIISSCDKDIIMTAGDTLAFGIEIVDQDGAPMIVDGITFIAKTDYSPMWVEIFCKTLEDGITEESTGVYAVRVEPADTDYKEGRYPYALRVEVGNDVYTMMKGLLTIQPKVYEQV